MNQEHGSIPAKTVILAALVAVVTLAMQRGAPAEDFQLRAGGPGARTQRIERSPAYAAYVDRLRYRREDALALRRQINAGKAPARGWLAIRRPVSVMGGPSFIQRGWVRQPPIPAPGYGRGVLLHRTGSIPRLRVESLR